MPGRLWMLVLCCAGIAAGCAPAGPECTRDTVFVGIPPLAFLAERIAADQFDVAVLLRAGQDAHTYEPEPGQVVALTRARAYFNLRLPFEQQLLAKINTSNAALEIVDLLDGIRRLPLENAVCEDENHAHDDEFDAHVWLDPARLEQLARNMANAFAQMKPEHAEEFQRRCSALVEELRAVDARLKEQLAPFAGRTFYVYHSAFSYFADAYGLRQRAVETGGKSPTPRDVRALIDQAQAEDVHVVFVQPQFAPDAAEAVAQAIGGAVLPLDDLASDVLANLARMGDSIAAALAGRK